MGVPSRFAGGIAGYRRKISFGIYPVTTCVRSTTSLTRNVHGDTRERERLGGCQPLLVHQEVDDLPGRMPRGAIEVEVDPHDHVVGVGLGAWTRDLDTLVHDETEHAGE